MQARSIEVRRSFDRFEDCWRTTCGSARLRDLFAAISPAALQRAAERVRVRLGWVDGRPVVVSACAHAVKGRRR